MNDATVNARTARRAAVLGVVLPVVALAAWLADPRVMQFRFVMGSGWLKVKVKTEGGPITPRSGLELSARDLRGEIVYDPLHPERSRVDLRVPVRALEPTAPAMTAGARRQALEPMDRDQLATGDEKSFIMSYVRSTWVLDAVRAPDVAFLGSGVKFGEDRGSGYVAVTVPGRLELRGRTAPARLDGIARVTTSGIEIVGRHWVHLSSYGIPRIQDTATGGTYRLGDEVEIEFHLVAVPAHADALGPDEVQFPKLTPRAERSGEPKVAEPELRAKEPALQPEHERSGTLDPKVLPKNE